MQELPGITDQFQPIGVSAQGLVGIPLTAAQISAPTSAILANTGATYYLNTQPYTQYQSNGTSLSQVSNTSLTIDTVNQLVAAGVNTAQNRALEYGNMPMNNAVFTDGMTGEQFRIYVDTRFASVGTNDPVVTTDPALGGTVGVGNVLTVTRGSVTNGSGGAHQDVLTWYFIAPTTGLVTVLFTETIPSANTPSTFTQAAVHIGGTVYVIQQAKDTVTTKLSNARTSNVKGPVTGTAPTNTGTVPSISGSAPSGSALQVDVGVWTGALNYVVQLYADGVPYGSPSAKAATNPVAMGNSDNSVVGKAVTAKVTAYSSLDVPSASAIATSNSITVTGVAPPITNTSLPLWPATINYGTAATGTPGGWSAAVNAIRSYSYYIGSIHADPPDFGPQQLFTHTPRLPAVPGNTLFVVETVYDVATGLTIVGTAASAGKVISAALATFAATLTSAGQAGYAWTQSSAITQTTIATLANGTSPYILDPTTPFSPALPAGISISISGTNVIATGTPTTVSSSTAYTVNFKDSAGSPASASITFSASVAAAGATAASSMSYPVPTDMSPSSSPSYGPTGTLTGSSSTPSNIRLASTVDPNGSGQQCWLHRVVKAEWGTGQGQTNVRAEKVWLDVGYNMSAATDYWFGGAYYPIVAEWPTATGNTDDDFLIMQIHTQNIGNSAPVVGLYFSQGGGTKIWKTAYNATSGGGTPTLITSYPMNASAGQPGGPPSRGAWNKWICHVRPGWVAGQGPVFQVWEAIGNGSYTKVIDATIPIDYNYGGGSGATFGSYPRYGIYKSTGTNWTTGNSIAAYFTTEYQAVATNAFANMVASLAGFV